MEKNLRIVSYNCRSVRNSLNDVQKLCDKNDIVMLQEHWLPKQDLSFLNSIHNDFIAYSSSPVDLTKGLLVGRPYGGLSVLFNKKLASRLKLVDDNNERLLFVELNTEDNCRILLVNCYMPYFNTINDVTEYVNLLSEIQSVVINENYCNILMLGDFVVR